MYGVLARRQPDVSVVIENVHDPHNVSAVFRSCDAVGAANGYLLYDQEEFPRLHKGVAASAQRWLDIERFDDVESCYARIRRGGATIYATSIRPGTVAPQDLDLTAPCAFVFGNESRGVSEPLIKQADQTVMIPMVGMVESLNISVAAAVILYEMFRQRTLAGMYRDPRLPPDEIDRRLRGWLEREGRDPAAADRLPSLAGVEVPRPSNRYTDSRQNSDYIRAENRQTNPL